jgi:hypothetical protein
MPHMGRPSRVHRAATRTLVLLFLVVIAGCATPTLPNASPSSTVRPTETLPPSPSGAPAFTHVYLLIMENRGISDILTSSKATYLASLIARYGLATNYDALTRGSQPNYLAVFSGSAQGVDDDLAHDIPASNLADQLEAAGRTWRVFAENVPSDCFTGTLASGGPDGTGTYARKHEPAISFTDISTDPSRCSRISDFSHFDPSAADFELIVPNLCHDMHDCSTADGDAFLAGFVPRIMASPSWATSVLFITFDEGNGVKPHPLRVATIVVAPSVRPGLRTDVYHDHYSLLRTIETVFGLPCLAHSCTANALTELLVPN